jgi:hypothetical protein
MRYAARLRQITTFLLLAPIFPFALSLGLHLQGNKCSGQQPAPGPK